jgi:hypothetical protein
MKNRLPKLLDERLARIRQGESVEACLMEHANVRQQLEPLLRTALSISSIPGAVPSDKFRKTAKRRLLARLHQEVNKKEAVRSGRSIWQAIIGAKKIAIPVTLALLLAIGATFGAPSFTSPSQALASKCTLSILSGSAEVQTAGAEDGQQGTDGMTLDIGSRVKISPDSHALLTFFDGSTIELEPGTDIEIQQLEYERGQSVTIVLKQWLGRTWSRVVKMADPASHYEIETPTACAIVRGTLFTTEVDEVGATMVKTTQGLVSVVAQGEEVYLPASQQTQVKAGTSPSQPVKTPDPKAEILIEIDAPAVGSVIDPTGASTGCLQDGAAFNQIPGSQSSSLPGGNQIITIPQPVSGEYTVGLRYLTEGAARVDIQGKSDGEIAFRWVGKCEGSRQSGWLIRFKLQVNNGQIVGGQVSGVKPLISETPEKIVKVNLLNKGNATPAYPQSQGGNGKGQSAQDNGQASVDGNNQGQSDIQLQSNNQGQSGDDPGQSGDTPGQSGDAPGQSGDAPDKSGDAPDKSGDTPGQSGDAPDKSGDTPGQSGDAPGHGDDNPGQSGDAPGQSGDAPGQSGDAPGQSGDAPGQSGDAPGQSGNAPGQSGDAPGQSGDAPGHGDDNPGQGGGQGK